MKIIFFKRYRAGKNLRDHLVPTVENFKAFLLLNLHILSETSSEEEKVILRQLCYVRIVDWRFCS